MHPIVHTERREKRAETQVKRFLPMNPKSIAYVDAASDESSVAVTLIFDGIVAPVSAAIIRIRSTEMAEEHAVALSCVGTEAHFIVSDSDKVTWNFGKRTVSPEAGRVLFGRWRNRKRSQILSPAPTSVLGNVAAHELA